MPSIQCGEFPYVPSPVKINAIPTFVLQNPAARARPRLSNTKPETVRRDGSNEVTWAFNESLSALLFTHHRFLLNRSIAAGRARAADSQICTARSRGILGCWKGSWGQTRPGFCVPAALACVGRAKAVRPPPASPSRVPRRLLATTPAAPWHHKRPQAKTMADGRALQHPIGATHLGMPTGARGARGPGSTVLSCPISLLGLKDANPGR